MPDSSTKHAHQQFCMDTDCPTCFDRGEPVQEDYIRYREERERVAAFAEAQKVASTIREIAREGYPPEIATLLIIGAIAEALQAYGAK